MRRPVKRCLIAAVVLTVLGSAIFLGAMGVMRFDFTAFDLSEYETGGVEISETFAQIDVVSDTIDVELEASDTQRCSVTWHLRKNSRCSAEVIDGALRIDINDTRQWYTRVGVSIGTPKVTIRVPQAEYASVSVRTKTGDTVLRQIRCADCALLTDTGDASGEGLSVQTLTVQTNTGDVQTKNCGVARLSVTTDTGDAALRQTTADTIRLQTDTGDVVFENSDAAEIGVTTATGDVTGTLCTAKAFTVHTDTGDADVPPNGSGGECTITTNTGDVHIRLAEK